MIFEYIGDSPIQITLNKKATIVQPRDSITILDNNEIQSVETNVLFVKKQDSKLKKVEITEEL